jgi:superoxide dismutase, Fe-Mn family
MNRRNFLSGLSALGTTGLLLRPIEPIFAAETPTGSFKLPPLPYAYSALAPHIDARTMEIHHLCQKSEHGFGQVSQASRQNH